jgi:hypothetical protein
MAQSLATYQLQQQEAQTCLNFADAARFWKWQHFQNIDNPGLNQVRQKKKDSCNLTLSTEWFEFIKIEILG